MFFEVYIRSIPFLFFIVSGVEFLGGRDGQVSQGGTSAGFGTEDGQGDRGG